MELEEGNIELRQLKENDLELLMAWRSHPKLYRCFYEQEGPLTWKEHYNWWKSRENRKDWIIVFEGKFRKRDVGSVNISQLDSHYPEIGILVGEISLWGKNIGKKSVKLAIQYLREKNYKGAEANIIKKNLRSKRLFKGFNFKKVGENRNGEDKFRLEFDDDL